MSCVNCGAKFCYRCGQDISVVGYDHFRGACALFDQDEIDRWEREMVHGEGVYDRLDVRDARAAIARQDGHAVTYVRCPACGQQNMKEGRNNDARCWACQCRFCALCGARIAKGEKHFSTKKGVGCPQHS